MAPPGGVCGRPFRSHPRFGGGLGGRSEASEFPFPGAIELRDDRQHCRTFFKPFRLIWKAPTGGGGPGRPTKLRVGAASPSAGHCSDQHGGRSISRVSPKPRGRRPSIAAVTSAGSRKAIESVCRMDRSVRRSPVAIDAIEGKARAMSTEPSMSSRPWLPPTVGLEWPRARS